MCNSATIIAVGFAGISALMAIVAAIWSIRSHGFTKKAKKLDVFRSFVDEYRTSRMHAAVRDLHQFKEKFDKIFKGRYSMRKVYKAVKKRDERDEKGLESAVEKVAFMETTLHHRRRLVSHFYHSLYKALRGDIVPKDDVFDYWTPGTIDEIIRHIVLQIGMDDDKRLETLCEMADEWKEEQSNRIRRKKGLPPQPRKPDS